MVLGTMKWKKDIAKGWKQKHNCNESGTMDWWSRKNGNRVHSSHNISIKSGCSGQRRCIRSVFNVSFSQRFTSTHLTQICTMYPGSFIASRASRSSSFGVRNAFPPCLFRHISLRSTARISTSVNNRPTKFELSFSNGKFSGGSRMHMRPCIKDSSNSKSH